MNVIVFLTSKFLNRPNVLVGIEAHRSRGKFIVDELTFSREAAIIEGVHICDNELLDAVTSYIRKDCKVANIMLANEETQEFEEVH